MLFWIGSQNVWYICSPFFLSGTAVLTIVVKHVLLYKMYIVYKVSICNMLSAECISQNVECFISRLLYLYKQQFDQKHQLTKIKEFHFEQFYKTIALRHNGFILTLHCTNTLPFFPKWFVSIFFIEIKFFIPVYSRNTFWLMIFKIELVIFCLLT